MMCRNKTQQTSESNRRQSSRGFTLVESMIVVALVGILSALSVYGVGRYVRAARAAEATNAVGRMARDAAAAYDRSGPDRLIVAPGGSVDMTRRLCVSASRTVPRKVKSIEATAYQSTPSEWSRDSSKPGKGFACLRFTMKDPQYFQYGYTTSRTNYKNSGKKNTTFTASAVGDLNGDGIRSDIHMTGKIVESSSGLTLVLSPGVSETNPEE